MSRPMSAARAVGSEALLVALSLSHAVVRAGRAGDAALRHGRARRHRVGARVTRVRARGRRRRRTATCRSNGTSAASPATKLQMHRRACSAISSTASPRPACCCQRLAPSMRVGAHGRACSRAATRRATSSGASSRCSTRSSRKRRLRQPRRGRLRQRRHLLAHADPHARRAAQHAHCGCGISTTSDARELPAMGLKVVPLPLERALAPPTTKGEIDGFIGIPSAALAFQWSTQRALLHRPARRLRDSAAWWSRRPRLRPAAARGAAAVRAAAAQGSCAQMEDVGDAQDDALARLAVREAGHAPRGGVASAFAATSSTRRAAARAQSSARRWRMQIAARRDQRLARRLPLGTSMNRATFARSAWLSLSLLRRVGGARRTPIRSRLRHRRRWRPKARPGRASSRPFGARGQPPRRTTTCRSSGTSAASPATSCSSTSACSAISSTASSRAACSASGWRRRCAPPAWSAEFRDRDEAHYVDGAPQADHRRPSSPRPATSTWRRRASASRSSSRARRSASMADLKQHAPVAVEPRRRAAHAARRHGHQRGAAAGRGRGARLRRRQGRRLRRRCRRRRWRSSGRRRRATSSTCASAT